ncbi:MAG: hypothetical protein NZ932_05200 [Candidatus Bathyarchaeota archaeon]|nr:hypothetical protein [Candidatus Bathyarchaeota archaeon]MDW8040728.1 hypothetical protein [Nitrososphaerota archaeon]
MPKFSRPFSISRKVAQLKETVKVDTQKIREKILAELQAIFQNAVSLAKGETTVNKQPLTIKERQAWARVAAYTAQVIQGIAKGFDERQIDEDLAKLEELINEAAAKTKAASTGAGAC